MNYVHNKADVIRAFIFVQTELKGFEKWKISVYDESKEEFIKYTAKEQAERVKQQLEDKDALGIVELKVFIDLSKEETLETFFRIKEDSIKFTEENNCKLGLFFVNIGFMIESYFLKKELDAPFSDTTMAH